MADDVQPPLVVPNDHDSTIPVPRGRHNLSSANAPDTADPHPVFADTV
ncbi:hypothetical protein HALLA_20625 (plasmid) [Halostagnicola larsenii XH-48]|uniref:Uncharacterized protein n=1 Tax=Halostagnicola larsenii XH-48 TaxID=797299 RepID=W0JYP8_9EURY|nr:hypothetical protein HALLA_20625 [Halostagnicola larsenii XH-48]